MARLVWRIPSTRTPIASGPCSIVVQADGKILLGGDFTMHRRQRRATALPGLMPITGLADSFDPNANGGTGVNSIAVQADGKIFAGGNFTSIGGQTRNYIARLDATTGLADAFDPNVGSSPGQYVRSIALQSDGKILAAGLFHHRGWTDARRFIARLDAITGLADPSFNSDVRALVYSVVVQADGKILVGR